MKKKIGYLFLVLIFLPCLILLSACNNKVDFKINFVVDGTVYDTIETSGNTTISMPDDPIKVGYTFEGWYWDKDIWNVPFTANSLLNTPLKKDMNVYAKFVVEHSHVESEWIIVRQTNCTTNGKKIKICEICNKVLSSEEEIATGHDFTAWEKTKDATYYELGEETRSCKNCNYIESRDIDTLIANVVAPTEICCNYGIISWDGSSPFGYEVILNGDSQTVLQNSVEPTFNDVYNEVKVASINKDGTKTEYVELKNFKVNKPISNLNFIDDGTNVTFTWDSVDDIYNYLVIYNDKEIKVNKSQHFYSVPRNELSVNDEVSVVVLGNNEIIDVYASKKSSVKLKQLSVPELKIKDYEVVWDSITNAENYKIEALSQEITAQCLYSYKNADAGNYTIKVFAFGKNYLSNFATLSFTKLVEPIIKIENNNWINITNGINTDKYNIAIAGDNHEFVGNGYQINKELNNGIISLNAMPQNLKEMKSNVVELITEKFSYQNYTTIYFSQADNETRRYLGILGSELYIPDELQTLDFSIINKEVTLICKEIPETFKRELVKSLIIPTGVTEVNVSKFGGIVNATSVYIPKSVTTIEIGTLENCKEISEITLPFLGSGDGKYTNIGYIWGAQMYNEHCLYAPECLFKVELLGGTTIERNAFYGISVSLLYLSSTINIINEKFQFGRLGNVYISNISQWFNMSLSNRLKDGTYSLFIDGKSLQELVIPNEITEIKDYLFCGIDNIKTLKLHNNITKIGKDSFAGCKGIEEIELNEGLLEIDDNAFSGCNIKSVTIPESVEKIGGYAFENIVKVNIKNLFKYCNIEFWGRLCGEFNLYLNNVLVKDLIIPNNITKINDYAFYNCTSLTSITIPASVTSIGEDAFYYCTSLETINYNAINCAYSGSWYFNGAFYNAGQSGAGITVNIGANVEIIPERLFYNCTSLTSITIPESVTSIGEYAFCNCTSLETINYNAINCAYSGSWSSNGVFYNAGQSGAGITVNIGANVEIIPECLFYNCTSLTSVTIPASVTSIGKYAFYNCTSLTSITIPESVTSIEYSAFYNCTSLTSITIPESVTSIGNSAFGNCTSLTSITIPESVTSIGDDAFYNCTSLTRVYYKGGVSDWNNINIDSDNSNLTNATRYYYSEEKPITDGNYWHYVDGVVTEWKKEG